MKVKNLICIILILIISIHLVLFLYFIDQSPLVGDGGPHQNTIEGTIEKRELISNVPFLKGVYGFPRYIESYPVSYPQIYYVFGAIIYPIFTDKTVYFMDLIITTILILISFNLVKSITKKKHLAIIFSALVALCSGFSYSYGNNNLILLFAGILTFYAMYNYLTKGSKEHLALLVIFSTFLLGTKQLSYFYLGGLVVAAVSYLILNKKYAQLKTFSYAFLIAGILWAPIIGYQISTTGTISTPAVEGWPIVDSYIFHPSYLEIEPWQEEIDDLVNISYLNEISARKYYEVNGNLGSLIKSPIDLFNRYLNPGSVTLLPSNIKEALNPILLSVFFAFGLLYLIKGDKKILKYLLIGVILSGLIVIKFSSRVEYFLFLPFFGLFLIASGIWVLINRLGKQAKIITVSIILILFILNTSLEVRDTSKFLEETYMRGKVPGGHNATLEISKWITGNTKNTDLILAANTQDLPYYSKRNFFWDYRLFFLQEKDLRRFLQFYPNISHVITHENQITEEFSNWVEIPSNSPLLNQLQTEKEFMKVYDKNGFKVYKIKDESDN